MINENFLNFVTYLTDIECPFHKSVIETCPNSIEVRFLTTSIVKPSDLGWLNTHVVGGEWFISTGYDEIHIVVRFYNEDEE